MIRVNSLVLDKAWDDLLGLSTTDSAGPTGIVLAGCLQRWQLNPRHAGRQLGARKRFLLVLLFDGFLDPSLVTRQALFGSFGGLRPLFLSFLHDA